MKNKYKLIVHNQAKKELKKLEPNMQRRIIKKFDELTIEPRMYGTKKLTNQDNLYRIRVGTFRIIYQIQDTKCIILVLNVGHRREIYKTVVRR